MYGFLRIANFVARFFVGLVSGFILGYLACVSGVLPSGFLASIGL